MTKLSGELAYRIGYDVEHDLFHAQNVFNDEYIKPTFIEYVQKLEEQIEKMKCCYNCKQSQEENYCKIKKSDVNDLSCWDCGCDKWEIKEND